MPSGHYTNSKGNRKYAVDAARHLRRDPAMLANRAELWRRVTEPKAIRENSQLDVVFSLWDAGLLVRRASSLVSDL